MMHYIGRERYSKDIDVSKEETETNKDPKNLPCSYKMGI